LETVIRYEKYVSIIENSKLKKYPYVALSQSGVLVLEHAL